MKDTSDAMEQKYRDMLLKRSGEERLKMGCSMHATAQALVRAAVLAYAESGYHNRYIEGTASGTYFSCRTLLPGDATKVHLGSLLGSLMGSVKSGCRFLVSCGFDGVLHVKAMLSDMYGNSFFWDEVFPIPCTEREEVVVEDESPLEIVRGNVGPFCVNLFKTMTFAAGDREAFKGNDDAIIKRGLESLNRDETFLSV